MSILEIITPLLIGSIIGMMLRGLLFWLDKRIKEKDVFRCCVKGCDRRGNYVNNDRCYCDVCKNAYDIGAYEQNGTITPFWLLKKGRELR